MRKFILVILALTFFGVGCKSKKENTNVIAYIGKEALTTTDLFSLIPPTSLVNVPAPQRKAIINTWISGEVLYKEAIKKGIDKDPKVASDINKAKKQIVTNAYVEQVLSSQSPVSDSEAMAYYNMHKKDYNTKLKVAHILLTDKDKANKVLNLLHKGKSFSLLAKQYSEDTATGKRGGVFGTFVRGDLANIPSFEDAAYRLKKVGDISGVVETPYGYHIIKLLSRKKLSKPVKYEDVANKIKSLLQYTRQKTVLDEKIAALKQKMGVKINMENLNKALGMAQ